MYPAEYRDHTKITVIVIANRLQRLRARKKQKLRQNSGPLGQDPGALWTKTKTKGKLNQSKREWKTRAEFLCNIYSI